VWAENGFIARLARAVALYLLRVDAGMSSGDAARLFGRARTDVVYLTGNVARGLAHGDSRTDVVASARRDLRRRIAERMPEPMLNDPPQQQPMLFALAKRRIEAGLTQAQLARRAPRCAPLSQIDQRRTSTPF
jgi:hypothetical protein